MPHQCLDTTIHDTMSLPWHHRGHCITTIVDTFQWARKPQNPAYGNTHWFASEPVITDLNSCIRIGPHTTLLQCKQWNNHRLCPKSKTQEIQQVYHRPAAALVSLFHLKHHWVDLTLIILILKTWTRRRRQHPSCLPAGVKLSLSLGSSSTFAPSPLSLSTLFVVYFTDF